MTSSEILLTSFVILWPLLILALLYLMARLEDYVEKDRVREKAPEQPRLRQAREEEKAQVRLQAKGTGSQPPPP